MLSEFNQFEGSIALSASEVGECLSPNTSQRGQMPTIAYRSQITESVGSQYFLAKTLKRSRHQPRVNQWRGVQPLHNRETNSLPVWQIFVIKHQKQNALFSDKLLCHPMN